MGEDAKPCPVVKGWVWRVCQSARGVECLPRPTDEISVGELWESQGARPRPPSLLHVWYWGPGHEDRAGVVGHFHQAYNVTIVSSSSVSSMQNLLVSHFSEAQRHPHKNLMSHISHLGFKLRKVSIWYIFPISMSQADCIYIKQEQVGPSLRCVLPLLFNFLTSSCKCKKWTEG